MIEEINEFVNRLEATPLTGLPASQCLCNCDCSCGADFQMNWTPATMNFQGWYMSS